jgi:lipoprotein-anchoring transpeptidase ErfK/SrfK
MKLATHSAKQTKAAWIAAAILGMSIFSGALQTASAPTVSGDAKLVQPSTRVIFISLQHHKLALLVDGKIRKIYRVAVGKTSTPSPVGQFTIVNRVSNPTYYHPGKVVAAGTNNPVGSRWMGLSAKGYGIHGTNQPDSIGKAASTGCIRMGKRDVEELFALVAVGDPVEIRDSRDEQIAAIFGATDETTVAQVTPEVSSGGGGQ